MHLWPSWIKLFFLVVLSYRRQVFFLLGCGPAVNERVPLKRERHGIGVAEFNELLIGNSEDTRFDCSSRGGSEFYDLEDMDGDGSMNSSPLVDEDRAPVPTAPRESEVEVMVWRRL
jgi:hypothetical protein